MEDIFGFKTCCGISAFDQNLEIHVKNLGQHPGVLPSYFDFKGARGIVFYDSEANAYNTAELQRNHRLSLQIKPLKPPVLQGVPAVLCE